MMRKILSLLLMMVSLNALGLQKQLSEQEAQQQNEAVASAQQSLEISKTRYTGGVDTYLQVITAQTIALSNERNAVDIQRRRMDSSVLLIKSLGGGWHVANLPKL